jgi:hypothetical protein
MIKTQIWKMPLTSKRKDFDSDKRDRARKFCFVNGWVGIGWECEPLDDNLRNASRYEQALKRRNYKRAARSAHYALAYKMRTGDLIWCRARDYSFWLAKVKGPWRYRNAVKFCEFDLYQVRKCKWKQVVLGDVPGPVKNAFAGRGSAICRIKNDAALPMSVAVWQKLTGEAFTHAPIKEVSFSCLGHDDLEDLVSLYLQAELRWFVIPSTAKRSTPFTEFELTNFKGERAFLQVKSGKQNLPRKQYLESDIEMPPEVSKCFVFDLNPLAQRPMNPKVERIDSSTLLKFALANQSLLPRYMHGLKLTK